MSINEVIKKYLPIEKQKLSYANKQYNYCFAYSYEKYNSLFEIKRIKCNKKLTYQGCKQISETRWHIYFLCSEKHEVTRWVEIGNKYVHVGQIKN